MSKIKGTVCLIENTNIHFAGESREYLGARLQIDSEECAQALRPLLPRPLQDELKAGDELVALWTPKQLASAINRANLERNQEEREALTGGIADFFD